MSWKCTIFKSFVLATLNSLKPHLFSADSSFIRLGLQIPKNKFFEAFGTPRASQSEVILNLRHVDTTSEIDLLSTRFSSKTRKTGLYGFIEMSWACGYQNNSFRVNKKRGGRSKVKSQILKLKNRDFLRIYFSFLVAKRGYISHPYFYFASNCKTEA